MCLTAFGTACGLMFKAFLGVEFLFTGGENKLFAAIPTSQRLVGHIIKLLIVFNFQNEASNKTDKESLSDRF